MKNIVKLSLTALCLLAVSSVTFAARPGAYVGGGLGVSAAEKPSGHTDNSKANLSGRLFTGMNFNQYFGLEAGISKYASSTSKYDEALVYSGSRIVAIDFDGTSKIDLTTFDVVGKGYLPIQNTGVSLYGLAGLALVHQVTENSAVRLSPAGIDTNYKETRTSNSVHPIYGVGVSYAIPESNWTTNVELTRLQGTTKVYGDKLATNANMLTWNVAYNFD